jgi:NADPH:quinone reductase-like Zn-dependent oxidoreductase
VIATTRRPDRVELLTRLGAEHVLVGLGTAAEFVEIGGPADAVLDLIGMSTLLDSCAIVKQSGRVCVAGFLGGTAPLNGFDPVFQVPSGVQLSAFASLALGGPNFPLSAIPFQQIVTLASAGRYRAKPARCFRFSEVHQAHALMERDEAGGKLVVAL